MADDKSENDLPSVFRYLDYRRFLDDWFVARKARDPRFSHRLFARLAGQKSPSLLLQVIRGDRNLTPANVESFAHGMALKQDEAAFFADLVELAQGRSEDDRSRAWERISASRRFREAREIAGQSVEYVSRWYYPAIRELAHRADFSDDPAWVARTLRPRVTPAQAKKALDVLYSLSMLERDPDGRVRPADGSVVTPHEVAGMAARAYHRSMLELARDAIEDVPRDERHLCAVTVCIPRSLVPRLKEELNAMQERLLDLCDGADGDPEQVHQLHLVLFPLSAAPEGGTP